MVVFAISVFGTTLPHIFYGESLLNHMNAMQGRGQLVASPMNQSWLHAHQQNGTHFGFTDLPANLCMSQEPGSDLLNKTMKSE